MYECVNIGAIWLGIKITTSINRKRRNYQKMLKELEGAPKDATSKKND